jgi:large subunit ribosomal protein L20
MRINAAARLNGVSYSQLMFAMKKSGAEINRKMLAEMAVKDADGFSRLVAAITQEDTDKITD